jgi:hypothetical protein
MKHRLVHLLQSPYTHLDKWYDLTEIADSSVFYIPPFDWPFESYRHRYMNYLDEVALRIVLRVVTPLEVN